MYVLIPISTRVSPGSSMDVPAQITAKVSPVVTLALLLAAAAAALSSCAGDVASSPGCACFMFGCLADCSHVAAHQAVPPCVPPGVATLRLSWRPAPLVSLPADALSRTPLLMRLEAKAVADLATVDERVFSAVTHLAFLQLTGSKVSQLLPDTFADNRNLSVVDLSDNQLESVPAGLFSRNPLLTRLQLSSNRIEALHADSFKANRLLQEDKLGFSELPRLLQLDLSANPLLELPATLLQPCTHLRSLNLSSTRLSTLPRLAFSRNAALEALDLSSNSLQALPASLLTNHSRLSRLDLSSNQLRAIPERLLSATASLRLLNLSHNEVQVFPAGALRRTPGLQVLDASWNQLRALPRQLLWWAPALQELRLAGNRVSTLHPEALSGSPRLRLLDLSHNQMEQPPPDSAFSHNAALRSLDLSHNQLTRLCRRLLEPAWHSLQVLRLSGNNISALTWPSMRPRSLHTLEMEDNPCSCSTKSVKLFVPPKIPHIKIEGIITKPRVKGKKKGSRISGGMGNATTTANTTSGSAMLEQQPTFSEDGDTSGTTVGEGGVGGSGSSTDPPAVGSEVDEGTKNVVSRRKRSRKQIVFCPYGMAYNAAGAESGSTNCKRSGTRRNTVRRIVRSVWGSPDSGERFPLGEVSGSGSQFRRTSLGVSASVPDDNIMWRHRRVALADCPTSCGGLHEAGCHSSARRVGSTVATAVVVALFALASQWTLLAV